MTIDAAAKFLRMSRGWAMSFLAQYEKEGNVDFSDNRGTKRTTLWSNSCLANERGSQIAPHCQTSTKCQRLGMLLSEGFRYIGTHPWHLGVEANDRNL
jgi:hypothetical protein